MDLSRLTAIFAALAVAGSVLAQSNLTYTDLHDFGGTITNADGTRGGDGHYSYSGVAFDNAGNMFGTTTFGGPSNKGIIWEITAAGVYKDLHDFGGTTKNLNGTVVPDGFYPYYGVSFDRAGNMYGTLYSGGTNGDGMIWKVTTSGTYGDVYDFGGTATWANGMSGIDGYQPYGSVSFNGNGDMFGTTLYGGQNNDGMLWEITASGAYRDLHDFGGTITLANGNAGTDGFFPHGSVAFDANGNIFGTAEFGGGPKNRGMIWELTKTGTYIDLHDFGGTIKNADGNPGPDGGEPPNGVAFDSNGNMYGITSTGGPFDTSNYSGGIVFEITSAGEYLDLHDFSGTVTNANGTIGPDAGAPSGGVTLDSKGNLYGTAAYGGPYKVIRYWPASGLIWEITTSGQYRDLYDFGQPIVNANGTTGPDGAFPIGSIAFDSTGTMYGTTNEGGPYNPGDGDGLIWSLSTGPSIKGVNVSPATIVAGDSSTGTVTLNQAAPTGGCLVYISSRSSAANVPTTILVAAGSTSASYTVNTDGVDAKTALSLTAKYGGSIQSATLTVTPAALAAFAVSPTAVVGGNSSTGTVTLNGSAGPSGAIVLLKSGTTAASVPTSVKVPVGQDSASFTVKTSGQDTNATATITATYNGQAETAGLTISVASLAAIEVNPSTVHGGQTTMGTVLLNGAAGAGGLAVSLTTSTSAASVPKSVMIEVGQSQATFTISTAPVFGQKTVAVTARVGSKTFATALIITPPVMESFTINPSTVVGGSASTGTVSLGGAATPGGVLVKLTSNSSFATTLPSIRVAAGKSSASFAVKTIAVSNQKTATIVASLNGSKMSAPLTVAPPALASFVLTPATVTGGQSTVGTVKLTGPAPIGGLHIALSSSSGEVSLPKIITVPAGRTTAKFTLTTIAGTKKTTVTITATFGTESKSASLTIL